MNSPSDINSRNATPAGGHNESINSSPVHGPRPARIEGWPKVAGYCPACGTASLFLGSGGWVTCSLDKCPNPTAVAELIEHRPDLSVPAPQPNPSTWKPHTRCARCGSGATLLVNSTPYCECCRASGDRVVGTSSVVSSSRAVDLDLDQIEARAADLDTDEYNQGVPANAPWRAAPSCSGRDRWIVYQPTGSDQTRIITEGLRQPFADFIAHAREDVPALAAEVRRLREDRSRYLRGATENTSRAEVAEAERDAARAEAEELRRQLLSETYRPEGVEIVMRELGKVKRERDAAVAEAARVREALQAVRELHQRSVDATGLVYCEWCDENVKGYGQGELWPCETVRALDAALDGERSE